MHFAGRKRGEPGHGGNPGTVTSFRKQSKSSGRKCDDRIPITVDDTIDGGENAATGYLFTIKSATTSLRDDEVTERCHGYQNYFFSLWTRPPNRTTLEAGIHTSARSSRQPCLTLHRCAPPVQRPPTTGNSSALVRVMSWV
jgi:hypothetical protein